MAASALAGFKAVVPSSAHRGPTEAGWRTRVGVRGPSAEFRALIANLMGVGAKSGVWGFFHGFSRSRLGGSALMGATRPRPFAT